MRRKIFQFEKARVRFLHHDHARVGAKFPRELALADIHGKNFFRAALQQTIRETTRRCAEINRGQASDVQLKMFQRVFEFVSAAADEFIHGVEREFVRGLGIVTGLARGLAIDANLPGENEAFGFFAAVAQAALDESLIEAGHGSVFAAGEDAVLDFAEVVEEKFVLRDSLLDELL